jgi:hypothetical protein
MDEELSPPKKCPLLYTEQFHYFTPSYSSLLFQTSVIEIVIAFVSTCEAEYITLSQFTLIYSHSHSHSFETVD